MRLWTIQPLEVIKIIEENGEFTCDTRLSENYEDFHDAYLWLVKQMDKRGIEHPKTLTLPLWAWHTFDKKHMQPNLGCGQLGVPNEKYACIEFEIPDNQVLLSDYNAWHYVLNRSWYDDSTNEEEWENMHAWFDSLNGEKKEELRKKSWQKIFNLEFRDSNWNSNGHYIQATFWVLKKSMIKNVTYFTEKEID